MKTRTVATVSAAIELGTGVALIIGPDLLAHVLLGVGLSGGGVAVARIAGCGLLALGLACWPSRDGASPQAFRALLVYNLLAGLYLGYLRVTGSFTSPVLWLACTLHLVLGILLARPAYVGVLAAKAVRPNMQ